ncbi:MULTISPECIES: amidohydrolase [unclassified Sphaerochaeta]|jgi:cytosine/adenosine deaminase-related metal-dependent hydrolase|uniref:amidohydrolase n=1 Tax=unclassified Sphaerochaeta TaxID=2637943 RepID=UPI0025DE3EDC|nr:amidohydrolase [Sphaerochaeta sp. UBA5856]
MNNEPKAMVFRHATILTENNKQHVITDGALAFEGTTITYVGPDSALPKRYDTFLQLDCSDCLLLPSLTNCHTHTGMVAFRSLGDDIADRLRRFLLPLERTCMTQELAKASAALAIAEMQLAGIGRAVDMYYYEQDIAELAEQMHFSLFCGETIMVESPCNSSTAEQAIAYGKDIPNGTYVHRMYAAHAPYSVTIDHLKTLQALAKREQARWTMHLSEMDFEMEYYASSFGMTPIAYLESQGLLDKNLLAAHCIHTTDDDLRLLAMHNVAVVHCPVANAKSAKGVARIHAMLQKGIPVCLGTDGPASGNSLDLFTQMRLCAILQKNAQGDRSLLHASEVVPMATSVAARVLGIEKSSGSLEVGKDADILVLGLTKPNMQPCFDPYSVVVYSAGVQNVRHLFTKGSWVVRDHHLAYADEKELRLRFQQAATGFYAEAQRLLQVKE